MLIIGHRGAPDHAPENTLLSFEKALEQGADMIELDIYVCLSGELVVIHDDRVDRTTSGTGVVKEMTLNELKSVNIKKGQKIPRLEEVLNQIKGRVPVNIELKGPGTAIGFSNFLDSYSPDFSWNHNEIIVSSFNLRELQVFKNLKPHIKRGALNGGVPLDLGGFAEPLSPWSLHYSIEFISPELVADAHKRGRKVLVYTVNRKDDRDRLKSWGVDGIFTNSPEAMLK
ncbi:MAG: glycerophosphodiester phosphodiesterase [Spirochaetales bacterium]|nr:glycerophosphodiester phosphodiesterase [Spirochaetales bacterium]